VSLESGQSDLGYYTMKRDTAMTVAHIDRFKSIYRSLWLPSLMICLLFIMGLTWNEVSKSFGVERIARLLLHNDILINIAELLLVWAISLLPWMFYRGAKILSNNAQVSYITGICFTLFLYAILVWHSYSLIPGVLPRFIALSLFLSLFQRLDIFLISLLQSERYNLTFKKEPFSIFIIRLTDLLFFPTFAWFAYDVLGLLGYLFVLFWVVLTGIIIFPIIVRILNWGRSDSNNRNYSSNEEHWLQRFREERQQKEQEIEKLMSRQDEDS
jgi:hypothetical protein